MTDQQTDIAAEFTQVDPADRIAYVAGATRAYLDVFNAIGKAAEQPAGGLASLLLDVWGQYEHLVAMTAVEGVLE